MRIQLLLLNIENVFITRKLIDIKQTIQEKRKETNFGLPKFIYPCSYIPRC